ncbi:hypothetical protein DY000_02063706 [Brassica cretica]|uniref:Uncharacterized protein n=1 Tax=Brassica cretica TaxID=69181 RepID=A0ABQ7B0J6_BRACR|nr:hypothetical protein DY000_02063706 [Brassica cretica]
MERFSAVKLAPMILMKRPYRPAPEAFASLTVSDLRTSVEGEWDKEKIRLILPQYEEDIMAIKPSISNASDRLVGWEPNEGSVVSSQLFPWILWTLRKESNKFFFNGCSVSPVDTLATAIKAAKEWDQMHKLEKGSSPLPPSITAFQHSASVIV